PGLGARARVAARLGPCAVRRRERRRRAGDVPPGHAARGDHPGARDRARAALRAAPGRERARRRVLLGAGRQGPRRGARAVVTTVGAQNAGVERIAAAFAGSGKRAALMPYLMGGFPDLPGSLRIGEAYADGGADLVELGVPFS